MNINDFLKLPIVKILATIIFLYYVYEKTKDNPRSISYHIKKENFQKAKDTIKFGAQNLIKNGAIESASDKSNIDGVYYPNPVIKQEVSEDNLNDLKIEELRIGEGGDVVKCGSEVSFEYALQNKNSQDFVNKSNIKIFVGEGFNKVIEKAIVGMKVGGVRFVDIPNNFNSGDEKYNDLIMKNKMVYRIVLLSIGTNVREDLRCE